MREGLHTTLREIRLRKDSPSSRQRWLSLCGRPSFLLSDVSEPNLVTSGAMLTGYHVLALTLAVW